MSSSNECGVCGNTEGLLRCGRCKLIYYCSKSHQKQDWSKHKVVCEQPSTSSSPQHQQKKEQQQLQDERPYVHKLEKQKKKTTALPNEGSSENEILSSCTESLSPPPPPPITSVGETSTEKAIRSALSAMPISGENIVHPKKPNFMDFPGVAFQQSSYLQNNPNGIDSICRNVIRDMDAYGVCLVDDFLGEQRGMAVLQEVLKMHSQGVFKDGQLVSNKGAKTNLKTIRGDQICWIDGREKFCTNIGMLISQVDDIVMRANKMLNNGKLGQYTINGRTKAMVACYPGLGSHYVKHVDNPNRDGRCITAIYYLNRNWDCQTSGGLLRIFPEGWLGDKVADIAPLFDRLLFFWSDRRNPHEVQPAYKTRYAITLWYFDSAEREAACRRYEKEQQPTS